MEEELTNETSTQQEENPYLQPEYNPKEFESTPLSPSGFPAPFGSKVGFSSIDLSDPDNEEKMKERKIK